MSGLSATNLHVKSRRMLVTKSCGAGIGLASLGECFAALSTKDFIVECLLKMNAQT